MASSSTLSLPTIAKLHSPSSIPTRCFHQAPFVRNANIRTCAKFEKFQGEEDEGGVSLDVSNIGLEEPPLEEQEEEDDSCLPSDLEGAVRQSSEASGVFVTSGGTRAIVELLIPQLQFLDDEGAQGELWELSRVFLDTLIEETGCQRVKAIFPDAGAAALLKYRWKDAAFSFASGGLMVSMVINVGDFDGNNSGGGYVGGKVIKMVLVAMAVKVVVVVVVAVATTMVGMVVIVVLKIVSHVGYRDGGYGVEWRATIIVVIRIVPLSATPVVVVTIVELTIIPIAIVPTHPILVPVPIILIVALIGPILLVS
ncbi:hypothetical protein GIB67_020448 [Kingdonia uniflora]|uniref:DUF1995 domain-containing protein n=1 Tax=Kingdonia uniflora TaxID=39325 RepID=A0A7J7LUV7_9MAGN|nr:hypothetical protein GIB67_020448 [Kingdonia uniflora]